MNIDNIIISNNQELSNTVSNIIKNSGYKKIWIADQLGISRQALDNLFKKQSFSLDDANKILNIIGYSAIGNIKKK